MTCTTADCNNPTDQYLCGQCVSDLQAWVDQAHQLAPELTVTIAKQDVLRKAGNTGGSGGKAGSAAPINLDAVQLQMNLRSVATDANVYATDANAAGLAWLIQDWCTKAERLISGPEAEHVDHDKVKQQVENIAPAMPTRKLLPWLRDNARLNLTSQHIRDWVRRGHLQPVGAENPPQYLPHEVIAAWRRKEAA